MKAASSHPHPARKSLTQIARSRSASDFVKARPPAPAMPAAPMHKNPILAKILDKNIPRHTVSFRMRQDVDSALRQMCADRKNSKIAPWEAQQLGELAVETLLRKEGYYPPKHRA